MNVKRIACIVLSLLLLLSALAACAEGFTIRNGITWGMGKDEILAAEGNPGEDQYDYYPSESGIESLTIDPVTAAGTEALIGYLLIGDSLCAIQYIFYSITPERLKATYTEKYGQPVEVDQARLLDVLSGLLEEGRSVNIAKNYDPALSCQWDLPDAYIVLLGVGDDEPNVFYFSEDEIARQNDLRNNPPLNTDGI